MNWIYYGKLYTSKFQAGCLAKRLEQDGWLFGYQDPQLVEVYRSRKRTLRRPFSSLNQNSIKIALDFR